MVRAKEISNCRLFEFDRVWVCLLTHSCYIGGLCHFMEERSGMHGISSPRLSVIKWEAEFGRKV